MNKDFEHQKALTLWLYKHNQLQRRIDLERRERTWQDRERRMWAMRLDTKFPLPNMTWFFLFKGTTQCSWRALTLFPNRKKNRTIVLYGSALSSRKYNQHIKVSDNISFHIFSLPSTCLSFISTLNFLSRHKASSNALEHLTSNSSNSYSFKTNSCLMLFRVYQTTRLTYHLSTRPLV